MNDDPLVKPGIVVDEIAFVDELCLDHVEEMSENEELVRFMALCSLRNRDFDIPSAKMRLSKYLAWRKNAFGSLSDQKLSDCKVTQSQVVASLLYICPTRLPDGSALVYVRMKNHNPKEYETSQTIRYWHFIFLSAIKMDPNLARTGLTIVNNFAGATLENADLGVARGIVSAVSKCMPVRIRGINLVNPPWVFRFIIPIMKSLFSAKLGQRINVIVNLEDLTTVSNIPVTALPTELGGELVIEHPDILLSRLLELQFFV